MPADIHISPGCKQVLQGLLSASSSQRMCMADLLRHPWFLQDLPNGALEMNDAHLSHHVGLEQVGALSSAMRLLCSRSVVCCAVLCGASHSECAVLSCAVLCP